MRIVAPLRVEALAVGGTRIGLRARRPLPPGPLLLVGVAGAVTPDLAPGDLIIADRILLPPPTPSTTPAGPVTPTGPATRATPTEPAGGAAPAARAAAATTSAAPAAQTAAGDEVAAGGAEPGVLEVRLAGAAELARVLRIAGLTVHVGAVGGADAIVTGAARAEWAARGALAVDMESGVLARTGRLSAVVRAIVDTPVHPLVSFGTLPRGTAALRALRRAAPVLSAWAAGRGEPDVHERRAAPVDITITLPGEVENS